MGEVINIITTQMNIMTTMIDTNFTKSFMLARKLLFACVCAGLEEHSMVSDISFLLSQSQTLYLHADFVLTTGGESMSEYIYRDR